MRQILLSMSIIGKVIQHHNKILHQETDNTKKVIDHMIISRVYVVDDRHIAICYFRGDVAKILCVTLAILANQNFLLP